MKIKEEGDFMNKQPNNMIIGLDIGTTKICAIVGLIQPDGTVDIVGIGTNPSNGLRKGVVINLDRTVESIRKAIEEAELMAGAEITNVYAGISGSHIMGMNSQGVVAIKNKEVTEADIRRVIDAAKAVNVPAEREIIHIIPQEFKVDTHDGIKDPRGITGTRLEVNVHIVTAAVTSAQNIIKCADRAGLIVNQITLQQLASAEAVLDEEEKELGVALVDIGGGTTDIAVFHEGSVKHTSVLLIGGNNITKDVAYAIMTSQSDAEKIKIKYGCAMASKVERDEEIEVPSIGGRKPRFIQRQVICNVIEPRVEEIFSLVKKNLEIHNVADKLGAGCVITGGTALLEGIDELAERILDMPVRVGVPKNIGGLVDVVSSPIYSTGVGLILSAVRFGDDEMFRPNAPNFFERLRERFVELIREIF